MKRKYFFPFYQAITSKSITDGLDFPRTCIPFNSDFKTVFFVCGSYLKEEHSNKIFSLQNQSKSLLQNQNPCVRDPPNCTEWIHMVLWQGFTLLHPYNQTPQQWSSQWPVQPMVTPRPHSAIKLRLLAPSGNFIYCKSIHFITLMLTTRL